MYVHGVRALYVLCVHCIWLYVRCVCLEAEPACTGRKLPRHLPHASVHPPPAHGGRSETLGVSPPLTSVTNSRRTPPGDGRERPVRAGLQNGNSSLSPGKSSSSRARSSRELRQRVLPRWGDRLRRLRSRDKTTLSPRPAAAPAATHHQTAHVASPPWCPSPLRPLPPTRRSVSHHLHCRGEGTRSPLSRPVGEHRHTGTPH